MSFHTSESAFLVIIGVILAAGVVTFHAFSVVNSGLEAGMIDVHTDNFSYLRKLLFAIGVLLFAAMFFGVFFIYPLIRKQALDEGKLRRMTASLSAKSQTLEQAALTDALTGIQNRRYFDDALKEYLIEFRRIEKPIGLMILDLDHFKQINDTYGHHVGDEVLKAVGKCLKDLTRYHDVVARLGGEEFAIIVPNIDGELLQKLAERVRRAISALPITSGNIRLTITTSVGLAIWDRRETAEQFVERADKMLYEAKRQGRNRVCA